MPNLVIVVYKCGTISVKISLTEILLIQPCSSSFSTTTPGRRGVRPNPMNPRNPGSAAEAHVKISRKMWNSTHCKIVTPENIILKLCTCDYDGEITRHANFGFNRSSGGFSKYKRNITTLYDIFDCPVLSLPFFLILRPGRIDRPIFTLNVWLKRRVSAKDGPIGVRTMGDHIWGKHAPAPPP